MEMHQLRYFVKIAEFENFTRAAEACGVSQPSLSQQISKLELELGQSLFERLSRRVVLTDAGRILLDHATQILSLAEQAEVKIRDAAQMGKGNIAVAAIPTVAPYLLPGILNQFTQEFPDAHVFVNEDVTQESIRKCLAGDVDIVLLAEPIPEEENLRTECLFAEELFVVMPVDHALTTKDSISIEDIETEQFVLLNEAHCLTDNVLSFCDKKSFQPIVSCRGSQLTTLQELVALGKGISLVPKMAMSLDQANNRVYRPVAETPPIRKIVMAWNKNRFQSRLCKNMMEVIREYCSTFASGETV